ncbi:MAG: hypothetical protein ACXVUE_02930, partial [Solirubrobacteraceae bacterium]
MRRSDVKRKRQGAPDTVRCPLMPLARPKDPYPDPSWSGWGDPLHVPVLSESMRGLLAQGLGVREASR